MRTIKIEANLTLLLEDEQTLSIVTKFCGVIFCDVQNHLEIEGNLKIILC